MLSYDSSCPLNGERCDRADCETAKGYCGAQAFARPRKPDCPWAWTTTGLVVFALVVICVRSIW